MAIEVSIADGNALMLSALSELFDQDNRFSLVSTTGTADAFLQTAISVPTQVGVLDWSLPECGAEKLIRMLRDQALSVRVVVCTHGTSNSTAKRAMAAGAAGFFSHSNPTEGLLDVVSDVADGKMVFPYFDVRELRDPLESLTRTESALLVSLSNGLTNSELAEEHGISINTVKFHLRNLYEKLDVRNRAQAIAYYYSSSAVMRTSEEY